LASAGHRNADLAVPGSAKATPTFVWMSHSIWMPSCSLDGSHGIGTALPTCPPGQRLFGSAASRTRSHDATRHHDPCEDPESFDYAPQATSQTQKPNTAGQPPATRDYPSCIAEQVTRPMRNSTAPVRTGH
jgi:hypothetical protein